MIMTELLYPLQYVRDTLLLHAAKGGHTFERLLSTPGIDVNIKGDVSLCIECYTNITVMTVLRTGGSGDMPQLQYLLFPSFLHHHRHKILNTTNFCCLYV